MTAEDWIPSNEADLVLLGLSRVSKTPTAAYLGWLGYRVANVSFAPEVGVPKEVKSCREKVIALTIKPKKLADIRLRRLQNNGFQQAVESDHSPAVSLRRRPRYGEGSHGSRSDLQENTRADD